MQKNDYSEIKFAGCFIDEYRNYPLLCFTSVVSVCANAPFGCNRLPTTFIRDTISQDLLQTFSSVAQT
jgi:hypothetical protein